MKIDIDRPSTWRVYKKGMCQGCWGACCTMPVEIKLSDLERLGIVSQDEAEGSIKKLTKRLIKEGVISSYRQGTGLFMLTQKANGDCYFLDSQTRLCTVYESRPDTCRDFPEHKGTRVSFCPAFKK
ncbi:MAG: YkgJ family cysteine cluster protein [Bdellovibrionia bacterium]